MPFDGPQRDIGRKSPILTYPTPPWGWHHWNFAEIFGISELESVGYRVAVFLWSYVRLAIFVKHFTRDRWTAYGWTNTISLWQVCFLVLWFVARTPDQFAKQHDPYGHLLFREFLNYLVILAFYLYRSQCRLIYYFCSHIFIIIHTCR